MSMVKQYIIKLLMSKMFLVKPGYPCMSHLSMCVALYSK